MSETKWRTKKERFNNISTEATHLEMNSKPIEDDGLSGIVKKLEKIKRKQKGFSKLPFLDDIYKSEEGFKTVEGFDEPDKKAQLKKLMDMNVFSGKEFNMARQIRNFVLNYAMYADIFYDVEVIMSKIHNYIVLSNKLESSRSALLFYQSMNRSRFNLDKSVKILTDSEINIALEAEYEVLSPANKQPYIDMMNKHKAKYEKDLGVANADADLIVSAIRGFSMTLICILICYNILYTWIHCEGKGFGNLIRSMNDNLPSFLTFIAKPAFTALTFIENAMNMPKVVVSFMDPVKLYLGMFAIVTYTGIFQSIAKSSSKLMVDSLIAILKGQFSKSPMVYILIVFVWTAYFGRKIIENPGFIAGVVPVFLIGIIYLITVIVSSLVLAPYFGLAISGYVVYRLICVIPLASAIVGMFNIFDDIDIQSNPKPDTNTNCSFECIKHYVQTMQFYIKNMFTIMFSILTIKTIIQFSAKLNNKNLKIALPTIMSFLLFIGLRKKYNSRCNPPVPEQAQTPVHSSESEIVVPPVPEQAQTPIHSSESEIVVPPMPEQQNTAM